MQEIKILVVDDEEVICKNVCSKISRLKHEKKYITQSANDIYGAFNLYEQYEHDIVITDICMPDGSGLVLAEKIRKFNKNTTILVLSGFDDFSYVRKAFLLGVNDYLLKPLSITELDEKLKKYINVQCEITDKSEEIIDVIEIAKNYINENIEKKISLKEICCITNMSYNYLSKLFKDKTGTSFSQYVSQRRMNLAKELLSDPRNRVSEISKKLGFQEPNHFSRAFFNSFGIYPTDYRAGKKGDNKNEL